MTIPKSLKFPKPYKRQKNPHVKSLEFVRIFSREEREDVGLLTGVPACPSQSQARDGSLIKRSPPSRQCQYGDYVDPRCGRLCYKVFQTITIRG